jgi:distribution and morphology protein 10
MDYIVHAFGTSTGWNHDNSYSSLTATSDALLSFPTPSSLSLRVSSLSTPQFATSYTLSTLGQIDGSISYLYSSVPLGHVPSRTVSIPLRTLVRGYHDVKLPSIQSNSYDDPEARKPILLHGTLALPPPSNLTALYARRINSTTLLSLSLNSLSTSTPPTGSGPPPASVLGHIQHDTGRYSIEGLASSDNALLGVRGLWNFGLGPSKQRAGTSAIDNGHEAVEGVAGIASTTEPSSLNERVVAKPSLLSAGAEAYYSPLSSVIGLSTGLRFTTLAPHNSTPTIASTPSSKPLAGTSAALSSALVAPPNVVHSSFPYTLTLTLTPLTGSLASTYSVKPTENLALSSRFGFNVYSWESEYVLGAEIWRRRRKPPKAGTDPDPLAWARDKAAEWLTDAQRALEREKVDREEENVIKLRFDDGWNIRALWTGRVKQLLVSAGVTVAPTSSTSYRYQVSGVGGGTIAGGGMEKRWKGSVGIEVAYSS